jgi:hypothetical protein
MTLFWLQEYPTMTLLSALFHFHPQTLQRMVSTLVKVLKDEIKWPSEEEWQALLQKFNPLLPPSLSGCVSIIDGSEFQIQQPSTDSNQCEHYSAKKSNICSALY